jgi:hypothetical protein
MKKITAYLLLLGMVSCGPSEQEKQRQAYEEQQALKAQQEELFLKQMDSLRTLTSEIIKTATPIGDTIIRYAAGMTSVPNDEIWEVKYVAANHDDTLAPITECSCPDYQKNMESVTMPHHAIINTRCIRFEGAYEVNENGRSSYATRLLNVTRPKYVPAGVQMAALKGSVLVTKRNKISDLKKLEVAGKLINSTAAHPNHKGLKQYYYTHAFNEDYSTVPLKFGKCTEVGEGD